MFQKNRTLMLRLLQELGFEMQALPGHLNLDSYMGCFQKDQAINDKNMQNLDPEAEAILVI